MPGREHMAIGRSTPAQRTWRWSLSTLRSGTRSSVAGEVTSSLFGDPEDVEAVVREDRVPGHRSRPLRCQEDGDVADLLLRDVPAQRRLLHHEVARLGDAAHGAAGERLQRTGG